MRWCEGKIIEWLHKGNSEPFKLLITRRYDDSISESNSSHNQDCLPFAFHYLGLSWCAWRSQTNWVYDKPNVSEENLDESGLTQCVTHIDEKLIVPRQGIRCHTKEVLCTSYVTCHPQNFWTHIRTRWNSPGQFLAQDGIDTKFYCFCKSMGNVDQGQSSITCAYF